MGGKKKKRSSGLLTTREARSKQRGRQWKPNGEREQPLAPTRPTEPPRTKQIRGVAHIHQALPNPTSRAGVLKAVRFRIIEAWKIARENGFAGEMTLPYDPKDDDTHDADVN